jgi:ABC-type phosphate transport system permease subunit
VAGATQAFNSLFFLGLVLFVLTFTLNVVSERFVRRVRQRY